MPRRHIIFPIIAFFVMGGCSAHLDNLWSPAPDPAPPPKAGYSASAEVETTNPPPDEPVEPEDPAPIASADTALPAAAQQIPASGQPPKPVSTKLMTLQPGAGPPPVTVLAPPPKSPQLQLDEALDFCEVSQEFWQKGELENALEALDQAYSLILEIDTEDDVKLIRQKEDLRFTISKRILEIYASRHIVVNGNHNAIPLTLNRHVQAEINLFTTGLESKFFLQSYQRSGRYRAAIVEKLKAAGLPEELSWLPLIESGFKVKALSPARALGLWQFIPSTGYKFGLKRNEYIDERLDPVKATDAAIAYLKELHQIFGDWTTVLAAYNCGEGRVLRVIRSQKINYLDNFWDLYELLPRETARYVPRFLATLHILKHKEKYGLDAVEPDAPLVYETLAVGKKVHLKDIAAAIDVPRKEIYTLNPELRYYIVPGDDYPVRVPPGRQQALLAKLDELPVSSKPRRPFVYHRIRNGETLSTIARRYRTSVSRIARANNIHRSNYIVAGRKLKIPLGSSYRASTSRQTDSPASSKPSIHVVKRGDNLWKIAKRFGTTTQKIQQANHLRTTNLHIGQVLKIPGSQATESSAAADLRIYRVKPGDSPFAIAKIHRMPLQRFLQVNRLTPRSKIYPGQTLYVE